MTSTSVHPRYRGRRVDVVVDVRTKLEFWLGHLPGATCIPLDQLPAGLENHRGITTKSRILLYCASGARSAAAATVLRSAGYIDVVDAGGLNDAREHYSS